MSMLRQRLPGGINRDIDLGPSGHTGSGHTFEPLAFVPTSADRARLKALEHAREYKRTHRTFAPTTPRCGALMPRTGAVCARKANHSSNGGKYPDHRSRANLDSMAACKKRPIE